MSDLTASPIPDHDPQTRAGDSDEAGTLPPPAAIALPPPVVVPIAQLKPHPRQIELFGEPREAEIRLLANQMMSGIASASVEVAPDYVVLYGYRHVLACRHLNRANLAVTVRADLAAQGEAVSTHYFVAKGLAEPGTDILTRGRCFKALARLGMKLPEHPCQSFREPDLKDWLVKQDPLMAPRTLDRYRRLLNAPVEVQQAVTQKKLKLIVGERVTRIPKWKQAELAQELRNGSNPEEAVRRYLAEYPGRRSSCWKSFKTRNAVTQDGPKFLATLEALHIQAKDRFRLQAQEMETLQAIHEVIGRLLAQAEVVEPDPGAAQARLQALADRFVK